ncbi:MAG: tRNA (adenosine(37)-N6)-dimethylallyltransferase MiaA [Bacteroidetes bacterium B1(2017)]|nr:MAG: tRNA (adenosine(37)-N6)-dimethylallyltransferase MiaA [Bacteroidetes bacterium B1(2017)]
MILNPKYDSIVVLGPTASGKTKLAVALAGMYGGHILSADSRMVYTQMDIGTGKDLDEYFFDGKPIPYSLINVCHPSQQYHIYQYQKEFKEAFNALVQTNIVPIICGGSGLYLEAVIQDFTFTAIPNLPSFKQGLNGLNLTQLQEIFDSYPANAFTQKADLGSIKRAQRAIEMAEYLKQNPSFILAQPKPLRPFIIGLEPGLNQRRENILKRLAHRLNNGLIEEVISLRQNGITDDKLAYFGLEYKFVLSYLLNQLSKEHLQEKLGIAIQQFAKRQMTYFRKMEKAGLHIHWVKNQQEAMDLAQTCFIPSP